MSVLKNKWQEFKEKLKQHPKTLKVLGYVGMFFITILSAFLLFISKKIFLDPTNNTGSHLFIQPIGSGGFSGIAQNLELIFSLANPGIFNNPTSWDLIYSISYWVMNIPVFILSYKYIGKKFSIFTIINVTATSLFIKFFNFEFVSEIAEYVSGVVKSENDVIQAGIMARVVLAGVTMGLSSGIALRAGSSSGGIDVFSYALGEMRGESVGKYSMIFNSIIITLYSILSIVYQTQLGDLEKSVVKCVGTGICLLIFSLSYQFISSLVIDLVNTRKKKVEIHVITNNLEMSDKINEKFECNCSLLQCKDPASKKDKFFLIIVVEKLNAKPLMNFAREIDPNSYVEIVKVAKIFKEIPIRKTIDN